jgi:hypothetical protein
MAKTKRKSVAKKPATKKPAAKKPAAKKPAAKKPVKTATPKAKAKPASKAKAKAQPAPVVEARTEPTPTEPPEDLFSFVDSDLDGLEFAIVETDKPDAAAFAPGTLVEHAGDTYSLVYSKFPHSADLQAVYDERGLQGGGYTWHGFIVHLLKQHAPDALAALEFDPEGSMFCAVSKDLAALRAVGAALAQLEDLELVKRLARTVDVSEYD